MRYPDSTCKGTLMSLVTVPTLSVSVSVSLSINVNTTYESNRTVAMHVALIP